jgi:Arc/MetJ-type ribon-helix-helix transcriptional regulator
VIRTQIQLTDELAVQIRDLAAKEHVSMAELIRRALVRFLQIESKIGTEDRFARALSAAGKLRCGKRDLSDRHDDEFAEASSR